jgi:hypothetical protein
LIKYLKPSTIIPSDLYVDRAADRQLRQIISDMGRPGYVLVARQMGKTNLLLHAQQTLDEPPRICRRLQLLRGWSHGQAAKAEVFT